MNITIPGRLHLIWNRDVIYMTAFFRSRRYHYCSKNLGEGTHK